MPADPYFHPDASLVQQLDDLLKQHRGLAAYELIKDLPALKDWRGYEGRLTAAKLASALGDQRLGAIIDWRNWKENPQGERSYFRALFPRFGTRGSALLLPEIEAHAATVEPYSETHSDLLALVASCYADVREFEKCHAILEEALKGCGDDPSWVLVQKSHALTREDRYQEALEVAEEARQCDPYYRAVLENLALCLTNLNRDEEVCEILTEASQHTDSPAIPLRLSVYYSERDQVRETSYWLDEYERKSPLLSKPSSQWLQGRRADQAYLAGDLDTFVKASEQTKEDSYHQRCLAHFRKQRERGERKRLEVEFVRQHNMTCGPATLAAITAFFDQPHDHLKIAEAICYDGTPWHKERQWCEDNGFAVREFEVTMEATKRLIDAGIPFSLTTQTIDSGHLQACIGYDERLGVILIRDPTQRHYGEAILKGLREDHPITGLRGLAFVPKTREGELAAFELPQQRAFDLYHELNRAFDEKKDDRIGEIMTEFRTDCPGLPLLLHAESRVASEGGHVALKLDFVEQLLEQFPQHQPLWLSKLRCLESLSRNTEARDFLQSIHRKPESDPFFDMEVGEVLCRDIRSLPMGQFYLRRALRFRPSSAQAHATYADSLVMEGHREEALRFRRAASRLSTSFEPYAKRYLREASYLGEHETAIAFLRERAEKTGDRDIGPHLTLLDALNDRDDPEGVTLVGELLKRFPEDGDLLLKSVTLFSGWNRHDEAVQHLEIAKAKVARANWLHVAARYWSWVGERAKSRQYWEELLTLRPLFDSAYEAVAQHLAEEQDRDAAVAFLKRSHEALPDFLPLLRTYIEWVEFEGPGKSLPLLRKARDLDPLDLWSLREMAIELSKDKQFEEALRCANDALATDPRDFYSHGVLGLVSESADNFAEAERSFRAALKLNIDYPAAFAGLMRVCQTFAERENALRFVRGELLSQVSDGQGIIEYRTHASTVVKAQELEKDLLLLRNERPDLWQTWLSLREHYHHHSQHDHELEVAREMTERFPLIARSWAELGLAARANDLDDEEVRAFQKATKLSPTWSWALRELSLAFERLERLEEALAVLDGAISTDPLTPSNYGFKADLLWKMDRRDEAITIIKRGLEISPLYDWGWEMLIRWCRREGRENEVAELTKKVESKRAHQWRWWHCLAEIYQNLEEPQKALEAIENGLKHQPKEPELLDFKAYTLGNLGRYEEALACCQTAAVGGSIPVVLQGREAWILMQAGQQKEAWDRMTEISAREPDYYFAHYQLANWAYETESWKQLKKASERMVAIRPDESESWGYLGQAEEALGDKEAALEAYTRALRANPAYVFAARQKAALEMKAGKLAEAEETLNRISRNSDSSFIEADKVGLELLRCGGKLTTTLEEAWQRSNRVAAELDQDPYYYLDSLFDDAKMIHLCDQLLSQTAKEGAFQSTAQALAWGRRVLASPRRKRLIKETLKSNLSDAHKAAILSEVIGGAGEQVTAKEIRRLVEANSTLLMNHYEGWSAVLGFYLTLNDAEAACRYGTKWREFKEEVHPAQLSAYCSLLDEHQGLWAGLAERKAILAEFPRWEGTKYLRLGVGFHAAMGGELEEAQNLLIGYEDRHQGQAFYDAIHQLTLAMIAAHQGLGIDCEQHARAAAGYAKDFPDDQCTRLYFNAAAKCCAEALGIFRGSGPKLLKKWANGIGAKKKSGGSWFLYLIIIPIIFRVIRKILEAN